MDNKTALNAIYRNLLNDVQYGKFSYWNYCDNKPLPYPYFNTVLYKHPYKNLFCWQNYGSSANKATKKDLTWIIKEIFRTTPEKFLLEYMTEQEYQRIQIAMKANYIREQEQKEGA